MAKPSVDYSVYLVTDSTPALLGTNDICAVVESALRGGVTIVQYRDKTCDAATAIATARRLHAVTRRYDVPLLINDRIDVAVEVGCEGVHIGQDDIGCEQARQMLGPTKIVGVTASSIDEALAACRAGADYLGIGTVYATQTKKDTKSIIGTSGVRDILSALDKAGFGGAVPTVCIGGVNAANVKAVLAESDAGSGRRGLDGVAVVSAIMAAVDPAAAARDLVAKVVVAKLPSVIRAVAEKTPLSHNMTNLVVQNFAANVALAVGASPIMSNYGDEAGDIAKLGGALVVNMGTVTPEGLRNYTQALKQYNNAGRPVVFDPVGAGATGPRREAVRTLLSSGYFDVIKGNEGEIQTVDGTTSVVQRGVDSVSSLSLSQKATLVRDLARRERNVIVMTGVTDVLSDGRRTFRVDNGHELLGCITGTGCSLGTTMSAMVAAVVPGGDKLIAVVAATVMYGVAAEMAAARAEVRGPGTFVPAFLDELYAIRKATAEGDMRWLVLAKVQAIEFEEAT